MTNNNQGAEIVYKPIGIIHTPFLSLKGMPVQPLSTNSAKGSISLFPEYAEGLKDLEGFSHIMLLYHLHRVDTVKLRVKPFMDENPHGIFATRAPVRPNAIGLSTVKLIMIEENLLLIDHVDILDGTPLLDIKPFYSIFDNRENTRNGWLNKIEGPLEYTSDQRFEF